MNVPANLNALRRTCHRDLLRLYRLERRHRLRDLAARGWRGLAGFSFAFLALFKMKIAATLGGKLLLAALIGIGFAWPLAAVLALGVLFVTLSICTLSGGGADCTGDCCCDFDSCKEKNARRRRLIEMIRAREKWLDRSEGSPPSRTTHAGDAS